MGRYRQRRFCHQPGHHGRSLGLGIRLRGPQTNHHHLSDLHYALVNHAGHVTLARNGTCHARFNRSRQRQYRYHPDNGGRDRARARAAATGLQHHASRLDDREYLRPGLRRCFGAACREVSGFLWQVVVSTHVSFCAAELDRGGILRRRYRRRFSISQGCPALCSTLETISDSVLQETLASKKDQHDYGIEIGKALTSPCTASRKRGINEESPDDERTVLLPRVQKKRKVSKPSWSQIFTPQSSLVLMAYTMISGLGVAFDSTFPVFLHHPKQDLDNNPDVKLPFKFTSGFGVGESLRSSSSRHQLTSDTF